MYFCTMILLYSFAIQITTWILPVLAWFNPKLKLFVQGRKTTFEQLKNFKTEKPILWMHCASLGEFEQGRPILEHPNIQNNYSVVLTFFSPSGYEVQKAYDKAALVLYLPLDSKANAQKFVTLLNPKTAVFVKYEIWPNLLNELGKQQIQTILISGIFNKKQFLFKPLGAFIRKSMSHFNALFVQDQTSKNLLENAGFKTVQIAGDTRFDRVQQIVNQDNELDFVTNFVANKKVFVAGSTWAEDEKLLIKYYNSKSVTDFKLIIAPHNIKKTAIQALKEALNTNVVLYSEHAGKNLSDYDVLIVDTVGLLTKIYSYASLAYVGGGFGKAGIHNILEPATFGVPIIIGSIFDTFKEAVALVEQKTVFVVDNQETFNTTVDLLLNDLALAKIKGSQCQEYINKHLGATEKIVSYLDISD